MQLYCIMHLFLFLFFFTAVTPPIRPPIEPHTAVPIAAPTKGSAPKAAATPAPPLRPAAAPAEAPLTTARMSDLSGISPLVAFWASLNVSVVFQLVPPSLSERNRGVKALHQTLFILYLYELTKSSRLRGSECISYFCYFLQWILLVSPGSCLMFTGTPGPVLLSQVLKVAVCGLGWMWIAVAELSVDVLMVYFGWCAFVCDSTDGLIPPAGGAVTCLRRLNLLFVSSGVTSMCDKLLARRSQIFSQDSAAGSNL